MTASGSGWTDVLQLLCPRLNTASKRHSSPPSLTSLACLPFVQSLLCSQSLLLQSGVVVAYCWKSCGGPRKSCLYPRHVCRNCLPCELLCLRPRRLSGGVCLSVCPSVCGVPRLNSRTERPRKPKIGTMVARQERFPWTYLEVKSSKVKVARSCDASDRFWPISRERNDL